MIPGLKQDQEITCWVTKYVTTKGMIGPLKGVARIYESATYFMVKGPHGSALYFEKIGKTAFLSLKEAQKNALVQFQAKEAATLRTLAKLRKNMEQYKTS